ncbi:MAG: hypothetical protein HZB76_06170 [Chlamydiae bacterium]|nr:hypothetical protein [Chlamydiota bacterium]
MKETKIRDFFNELMHSEEFKGNLEALVEKSVSFFQQVSGDLANATDEDREKMVGVLKEIENNINLEFNKISEKVGISRSELEKIISDPSNFTDKENAFIQEFQKKFTAQTETGDEKVPAPAKKAKAFRSKKSWMSA